MVEFSKKIGITVVEDVATVVYGLIGIEKGCFSMKHFDYDKAVKRYNDIMMSVCYEHSTIGTEYSQNTDGWNVRDMVAECDYVLSCYYEVGHCNEELRHSEDPDERKLWRSETGKLQRFIDTYKPFIEGVVCAEGHCSRYDNHKEAYKAVDTLIADASQREGANGGTGKPTMDMEIL